MGQVFLWVIKFKFCKKTIFTVKKKIILCVNYRTLHVDQPDVASGVWRPA